MRPLRNFLRNAGRCCSNVRPVIIPLFIISSIAVAGSWKRIGFAGEEIAVIAAGKDAFRQEAAVFVPVKDSGIYIITATDDSIRRFPSAYMAEDKPVGTVHSLYVSADGIEAFAGTDSGLYTASLNSAALPAWRKALAIPSEPVYGVASTDSAYCAITKTTLYQSKSRYGVWAPCSIFIPPSIAVSSYTALVAWPHNGFAVASVTEESSPAFESVLLGNLIGNIWVAISGIAGCTDLDDPVYSLATDSAGMLYAGTSHGVYYGWDFDTGCWHPAFPQLPMPVHCIRPYGESGSDIRADLFAATDSGLYLQSLLTTSSGIWNRMLGIKTFAVEIVTVSDVRMIYAATVDGVWKYDPTTDVRSSVRLARAGADRKNAVLYSLDGRRLTAGALPRIRGVCIMATGRNRAMPLLHGIR